MPNISGLELAEILININPKTYIVFQTAYEEFALDAFKKGGIGYLLKPISNEDIKKVLEKINLFKEEKTTSKRFLGRIGESIYILDMDEIFYIKADLDEIIMRTKDNFVYAKRKIGDIEDILKDENFFRIHRSYLVNIDKIKSIKSVSQSRFEIYFNGIDEFILSSKEKAKEFREYLDKKTV